MTYSPNFRGESSKGSSRQNRTGYQNGTMSTLDVGTPVSTNASGQIIPTDVSDESSVSAMVGFVSESIPSAAIGRVVSDGRLEEIPLLLGFAVGDPIYIGLSGNLINVKPSIGVSGFQAGDFVVFVGVVVENEFDPAKQDIQIFKQIIGQL